ncbi:sigma-70 family RNA polymerase sigma factor [Tautonia marina]|uniref:sigma-70 family RNA polymerase sigma factor n=1 Tax=Tautonia marina TaxID=2653855 RepID=UPI0012610CAD|nr:sigma-70 family RNA polymerase sigma factor [Tautonia marina]
MYQEKPRKQRPPLTEDQQRLAVKYLPMARSLARPFKDQFPDIWEEFESAACLALVEAARAFEPSRAVKFSTFARQRISGGLRDVRRERILRSRNECQLADGAESGYSMIAEFPGQGEPIGAEMEAVEAVETWLKKLPRQHAETCRMIYLEEKTHAEVAERLGFSPSRITYIHLEALAILGGTWTPGSRPLPPAPRRRGRPRRAIVA